MTTASRPKTLRELSGLPTTPPSLAEAVLVVIDAQREYLDGRLPLDGIDRALDNIEQLLIRSRQLNGKVVHVVHQGRPGGTFDPEQGGRIIVQVAPVEGEPVIAKTLPNAFTAEEFRTVIAGFSSRPLVLAGFMTHMCVSATARAALDAGLAATVASDACATRPLPSATTNSVIPAASIHDVAFSELGVPVPWTHLVIIYGATLGAASLSFTPAGIGIVESAIALALAQSGVPTSAAIVAALLYRAVSCWLALAVGWVSYAVMRQSKGNAAPALVAV